MEPRSSGPPFSGPPHAHRSYVVGCSAGRRGTCFGETAVANTLADAVKRALMPHTSKVGASHHSDSIRPALQPTYQALVSSGSWLPQDLVDTHIFKEARPVMDSLREHNCTQALQWCRDNQTKLKKIKSKLEFKLHVQVCRPAAKIEVASNPSESQGHLKVLSPHV